MQQLHGHSFRQVVQAAFDSVAVRLEGSEEKGLHKPGVEGLQVFLEGCRVDASRGDVSADVVSVESVKSVHDMIGWDQDSSFTRDDLVTLLEALCGQESEEEDVASDISEVVDGMRDRAAAN